jgi:hypothetical protein
MLFQGALTRPLDIFDLFIHTAPLAVLALRVWRLVKVRAGQEQR